MAVASVTTREYQLLVLLAHGRTLQQAAAEMGIARQTAKNLASTAYAALGVDNRWGAFLELGWLTPPRLARRG